MTISSSRSAGPRHVGRIVDPAVREDGDPEPDLQLASDPEPTQASSESPDRDPEHETSVSSESSDVESSAHGNPTSGELAPDAPVADGAAQQSALATLATSPGDPNDPEPTREAEVTAEASSERAADASETESAPASGSATSSPTHPTTFETASSDVVTTAAPVAAKSSESHEPVAPQQRLGHGGTNHPVRSRLLARAESAKAEVPSSNRPSNATPPVAARGLTELDGFENPRTPREAELDRIGTPVVSTSLAPSSRPSLVLSPNMIAVFGSLIGLATVASLIALAMNLDGEHPLEAVAPSVASSRVAAPAKPKRPPGAVPERIRQKIPGPWRIVDEKDAPTSRIIEAQVGAKAFLVAVADAGIKQKEAYRLLIAYKGLRDLDNCDKSHRFRALVETGSGRLKAFEYEVSPEEVYQAREDTSGHLKAQRLDLKVDRHQVQGAFMYDGETVKSSAKPAGFEEGLARVLATALDGQLDIDELEKGDRLRVVAQEVTVLGDFARYAGVEALEILPHDPKQKPLRVYYFHHGQAGGYYNARGQAPYEGGWRKPIKDAPITSKFNPNRMHPVLKKVMPHTGTDFGAPAGTPVGASSFGTVSFIGPAGPSGNLVKVEHTGGIETGYAHLSRFAEGLVVGDKVKRLELVGYVGSTGRSTGPHLHFTVKKDGKFIDPETLNLDGMRVLASEYRGEFETAKLKYDKLLNAIPLPPPYEAPKQAEMAKGAEALPGSEPEAMPESEPEATAPAHEDEAEDKLGSASPADPSLGSEAPQSPAPAKSPAKPAAKGASAVYLTDKELLEMQATSDEGEVEE